MLRHKLTVPPSYCRDVVIAGNIIQTVQDGLRQAYECLASAPMLPKTGWYSFSMFLLDEKWLVQEGTALGKDYLKSVVWLVFVFTKVSTSPRVSSYLVKAYQLYLCCCKDWKLLIFDVATSTNSAVSFDAAVLDVVPAGSSSSVPADYVSAGHVLVSADRDRIC
ncbi:hypothetical protein Tco_1416014 [Tanacetum coccineum]